MIRWAITFLIIALIAAVLGFGGIASVAKQVAWILAVIGIIFLVLGMLTGRRV